MKCEGTQKRTRLEEDELIGGRTETSIAMGHKACQPQLKQVSEAMGGGENKLCCAL